MDLKQTLFASLPSQFFFFPYGKRQANEAMATPQFVTVAQGETTWLLAFEGGELQLLDPQAVGDVMRGRLDGEDLALLHVKRGMQNMCHAAVASELKLAHGCYAADDLVLTSSNDPLELLGVHVRENTTKIKGALTVNKKLALDGDGQLGSTIDLGKYLAQQCKEGGSGNLVEQKPFSVKVRSDLVWEKVAEKRCSITGVKHPMPVCSAD